MSLSRTDLVPVLAIVVGGAIGGLVSFSFLGSRSDDVPAPEWFVVPAPDYPVVVPYPHPVVAPSTLFRTFRLEMPPLRYEVPPLPPNSVEAIAAHLVREQRDIAADMDRLAEERGGRNSEAGRRLLERKGAMLGEIADLEGGMLLLLGETRADQGDASDWLEEARKTIKDDDKLWERVRYSQRLIGIQDRGYTREFEAETSRIVEALRSLPKVSSTIARKISIARSNSSSSR